MVKNKQNRSIKKQKLIQRMKTGNQENESVWFMYLCIYLLYLLCCILWELSKNNNKNTIKIYNEKINQINQQENKRL